MLGTGSSFTLCTINQSILTQHNTDNSVTNLNYGVDRGFPSSLMLDSVLSTAVYSP